MEVSRDLYNENFKNMFKCKLQLAKTPVGQIEISELQLTVRIYFICGQKETPSRLVPRLKGAMMIGGEQV